MAQARGRITLHPRGFGFLNYTRDDGSPASAFVPPPELNAFLDGDVAVATVTTAEDGRTLASGLALAERSREALFGTLSRRGERSFLKVDRTLSNTDWPFAGGDKAPPASVPEGAPLVARVVGGLVELDRVLPEGADLALERCLVRHGVRAAFPEEALEEARRLASRGPEGPRRDLRALPTVTIDAASTRDIDDALSALPAGEDGAMRVLVSIADVDAFVPEGSALDREARARGTSVYLAGRVVPMLPEVLSEEAVSLLPGVTRPAMTVEMRIDPEGAVTSVDVYPSLVRSSARLTYEAVFELLARGASASVPDEVVRTLRWLRTAAARLGAVRAARGGVELAREEASVTLDLATGAPVDVSPRPETEAHRLVERLMVAANECVARWLVERGLPGIFRVHEAPTEERVSTLARFADHFGILAGFGPRLSPRGLAAFDAQLRSSESAPAIRTVLGRVLGPARYSAEPGPHFGLGAPLYLHFTSPIRRYADLAVHRVVKRYLEGERAFRAERAEVADLADAIDRAASRASKAEAERHRMLVARLLAKRVGEVRAGHVVAVQPFGLVVQMTGTGATGTVALDALPGGPHRVDLGAQALVPTDPAGRRFSVGDRLEVEIAGADEDLGRVELRVASGVG